MLACLALLACGGGGGGGSVTPVAPATPNRVGLEFRSVELNVPNAPDGVNYRTAEYERHWGLENIRTQAAYQRGYFGQNVTIAIADGQKTRSRKGQIWIDHLVATGSSFVDAFYRGRPQSLKRRQAVIDLRAEPTMHYALGYALPVQRGAQLAFGLECEDEALNHGVSAQLRIDF